MCEWELRWQSVLGLQRFGSSAISTHQIGLCLLRGEYDKATSLILHPREGGTLTHLSTHSSTFVAVESEEANAARKYYMETLDAAGTLKKLPPQLVVERFLLQGLQLNPSGYLNALQLVSHN